MVPRAWASVHVLGHLCSNYCCFFKYDTHRYICWTFFLRLFCTALALPASDWYYILNRDDFAELGSHQKGHVMLHHQQYHYTSLNRVDRYSLFSSMAGWARRHSLLGDLHLRCFHQWGINVELNRPVGKWHIKVFFLKFLAALSLECFCKYVECDMAVIVLKYTLIGLFLLLY